MATTVGACREIVGVEFVKTRVAQLQFLGCLPCGKLLAAMGGQEMTDERSWQAFDQL